jgi:hypothetical protein
LNRFSQILLHLVLKGYLLDDGQRSPGSDQAPTYETSVAPGSGMLSDAQTLLYFGVNRRSSVLTVKADRV